MTAPSGAPAVARALLHDGALTVAADPRLQRELELWMPRFPGVDAGPVAPQPARIELAVAPPGAAPERPTGKPLLRLGLAEAWLEPGGDLVALHAGQAGCWGEVDLGRLAARLHAPEREDGPRPGDEVFSMLTLSAALLLGRLGRTLVHGAAAVDPAGRAWLLVGDTHAGKTTTTATLLLGGWSFLSDDHAVLSPGPAPADILVEGWPRMFHLDEGWESGAITGRRASVDPFGFAADRWRRTAPLGGILLPRVRADAPTRLRPIPSAVALSGLIRQSPWLMADRVVAAALLEMLRAAAHAPTFELSLGRDSYRDPERLLACLAPLAG